MIIHRFKHKMVPLGRICEISIGRTPSRNVPAFWGAGYPWLSISDMTGDIEVEKTKETVSKEGYRRCNCKLVPSGTLLMSFKLSIGKLCFNKIPMLTNEAIAALHVLDANVLSKKFLYFALQVVDLLEGTDRAVKGATLNKKKLQQLKIPLPPLEEQKRIAVILDKADGIRRKRQQAMAMADEFLRSVFLDMFGDPVTNPKGWEVRPLEALVQKNRPITYGILKPGPDIANGIAYVRVVDMINGGIDISALRRTTKEIAHSYKRSTVLQGDILISIRGHVGRTAIVPENLKGANITQDTARIAIGNEAVNWLVRAVLDNEHYQFYISKFIKGAAVKGINLGDLKKLPIPTPPLHLQMQYAELVEKLLMANNRQCSMALRSEELFSSANQDLFCNE